ncbi:uncharacterized protein LOC134536810 isoform X23 [Bacillus rossius redtenbacheri]|uniref:uncharacterized protein LOC134536810 isoform X23 n=1 Tax=Bacillus rossius redtenbacheri TaxID=93214 RepID=UPI002FDE4DBE
MFYDAQLVGALNFVRLAKTFGYHSYKIGSQSEGLRIKIGSCVSGQCAQAILNHVKRLSQTGHLHKIILLVGIYDLLVTAVDYWAECCLPTTAMDTRVTTGRAVKSYEQSAAPSEGVCRLLRAGEDVSVQVLCVLCQVTAVDYWVECCLPTTAMATRVTTGRAVKSYEQSAAPSEGVCRLLRAGEDVSVQVLCVLCQVTAVDYWAECCLPTTAMATRVTTGRAVKSYEQSAAPSEGVCRLLRAGEDVSVQVLCVLCQVTAVDYWAECCLPTTAMATRVTTGRAVKSYEQSAAPSEGVCRLLRAGEDVTAVDYWAECCLPTTAMDTRVTTGRAVKSYEQSAAPSEGVCRLLRAGEDVSVQVLCVLCQVTAVDYWVECCLPTTAMATRVTTGRAVKSYEQSAAPSEGVCRLLRAGEDVSVQVLCVLCQVTAVDYWVECCLPTTAMATRVTTGRAVKSYEQSAAPSEGVCRLLRAGEDVSVQVLCVLCQVTAVDYWVECCLPTTAMATRVTTGRAVKSYEQSAAPSEGVCRLLRAGEDVSVQVLCVLCQVTAVDYWVECCLPTTAMATRVTTGRAVKSYEQSAAPSEGVCRLLRAGEDVSVQVLCVLCQVTAVDYWVECCLPTTAMDTRVTTGRSVKSYEQSAAPSEGVCRLLRAGEDVSVQVLCVLCQVTAVDYWVECCLPTTAMATRVTTGRAVKSYEQSAAPSEGVRRLLRAGEDLSFCRFAVRDSTCVCAWRLHPWEGGGGF